MDLDCCIVEWDYVIFRKLELKDGGGSQTNGIMCLEGRPGLRPNGVTMFWFLYKTVEPFLYRKLKVKSS